MTIATAAVRVARDAARIAAAVEADGCALIDGVFSADDCARFRADWHAAQRRAPPSEAMRLDDGDLFAARDVLSWFPEAASWIRRPLLLDAVVAVLGAEAGLVRILFFDKPPERTWSLPWHQDMTIAVAEHLPHKRFTKPTVKAGVPHFEAPTETLERMLTLRIHLDATDPANGALRVQLGSHRHGKELRNDFESATVTANAGDVFAMRPLLAHASGKSDPESARRRRIMHFEFAADATPGEGLRWRNFVPIHPLPMS